MGTPRNWTPIEVTDPRGAWSLQAERRKGNAVRASIAQNVRISPGVVQSRPGLTNALGSINKVTFMYQWLTDKNRLIYLDGEFVRAYTFNTNSTVDLNDTHFAARSISCADLGTRLYFSGYNFIPDSVMPVNVWNGGNDPAGLFPYVRPAFQGPLNTSSDVTAFTAVDGGAGQCTQGTHRIGFIFQNAFGFSGKPSPIDSFGTFVPVSVTLNSGLRSINVTLSLAPQTYGGPDTAIFPIMTRSDNPDLWYFIPASFYTPDSTPVSFSAPTTINFVISISDEDLAASATEATDQFSLLTQDTLGNTPIFATVVAAYGKRMCYVTTGAAMQVPQSKVYISDIDNPQAISEDRNVIQMLNKRNIVTVFPLGTQLFLTGDKWTGSVSDNSDFPATWPQPVSISETLGAVFPNCVEWRTAGSYAWVVAEPGVYVFNGTYPNRPITYFNQDVWSRVNWKAAYAIQVTDDVVNQKCYVAVPLDSATECTACFVIDYTNGITFDSCDVTVDLYTDRSGNLGGQFSSIRVVKELATNTSTLWVGPAALGVIGKLDDSQHTDFLEAFTSKWESGLLRNGELRPGTVRVGYANFWLRGQQLPLIQFINQDRTSSTDAQLMQDGCVLITSLSQSPGIEYVTQFDLSKVDNYTMLIEMSTLNGWFSLSGFTSYLKPDIYR